MPMCTSLRHSIVTNVRQMLTPRSFFIITCISFTISVTWIQFVDKRIYSYQNESLIQEALENVARDYRFAEVYRKADRLPNETKFILLWTTEELAPFYILGQGQRKFIEKNCAYINCYVTSDRYLFDGDTTKFDAVAFNGRSLVTMSKSQLPHRRSDHQKFIYFNMESADNYPICSPYFDDFFNWTSTYRLDSDIPFPYLQVRYRDGEIIGPKAGMDWDETEGIIDEDLFYRIQNKTKAVAWFVSNCKSRSHRLQLAKDLQRSLSVYGYSVDIYGKCGPYTCPREQENSCNSILEKDYFFYLAFENSFSEDYVTEKLLTALQHDVVPIVFGGADYSRFLPPGSYLDARKSTPEELASTIVTLIEYPKTYSHYLSWKRKFTYKNPMYDDNVCAVCAALNERMDKHTTYKDFRSWWVPNYEKRCAE
ncbi:alpha-(1,3)-fucosyltransferase C-like isoform X1 [Pieris brassicae]|uniref:alpha-(1,3)-fucosyltransferase C-like isoform X1 n=1 Tax=Pieris brassicae TaxID=7116 RepID=UPI001E65E930|nr:alpha-(1,3)-fucosyltransferase C-like isoform X1 [Pieris brassicae]XP_045520250.1 alpha-(1,3)-fucosyltransferase C-like isoform X1 [Pieris brassicae]XP_045520251.1 alpha-(1,3)-fucosyltransferase C-like isoform X1 [Pieris brassicae]XP_045520252.1 alpha-(1,3)-fucosyltransferase C-like isoform X1 [Pieris brassicae]